MTIQSQSQLQSGANEISPEQEVMHDCDQRVFYEIFIRSFYDSNGDGIGDLNGITQKLDYLQQLGIGGLWLTPFNPSPSNHKYDVTDYFNADEKYGTLDDFKKLVSEAHKRNILVLMDLVVNHTSSQHPWFKAAVQNDLRYRDYYVWSMNPTPTKEGGWYTPPSGVEVSEEKYYAYFWKGMPDLNFDNQEVRKEIIAIGKWWLQETGIDGFRLDAAQHIYDPNNPAKNVQWWKEFTDSLKHEKPDVICIGECWNTYARVAQYTAALSGAFNFQLSRAILKSLQKEKNNSIAELLSKIRSECAKYSDYFIDPIFLSNHDNNRILSDLDTSNEKAKLAACIYLTFPGTPFIYYGEEIGMRGKKPDSLIREPFLWGDDEKETQTHWEVGINSTDKTVKPLSAQLHDHSSFYNHYRKLIALRKENDALTSRHLAALDLKNSQLLSYTRGEGELLIIHNLSGQEITLILPEALAIYSRQIFSSPKKIHLKKNELTLLPYSTIILSQ
ncbi:MAG TPA: alpha-amylase family glycosyl hydrolase [Chitinophagales bacterium]|nr:alpha-amylase family glycosyl hydrolase [Chitinophagales bacterium]